MGIGESMKKIRKEKGLTQTDVARDLKISQSYISAVECGTEIPNVRFVKLYCLQYGIDESELLNEDEPKEMRNCSMEQLTIDCIAQHLIVFHEQAVFDKTADFGEPCSTCPHAMKECKLEWLTRMKPLFDRTDIQIRLCYPELASKRIPAPDNGTDVLELADTVSRRVLEYLSGLSK